MSTLTAASPPRTVATGTRTAVTAAGLAGAVASAGTIAGWFTLALQQTVWARVSAYRARLVARHRT